MNKEKQKEYKKNYYLKNKEKFKQYYQEHKEHKKEYRKKYCLDNMDKIKKYMKIYLLNHNFKEYKKQWQLDNKEKIKKNKKEYYLNNKEQIKIRNKIHKKNNRDKYNKFGAKRRATKLNATVSWADEKKIAKIYELAHIFSLLENQPYHVDHIIPLQNKLVCGLHIETNLQILTESENCIKHNTFKPFFEEFNFNFK